jgi:hypothetical protein
MKPHDHKPKRGRPPTGLRRTERYDLRLHPKELAQLRADAEAAGLLVSEYIRKRCGLKAPRA